MRPVLYARKSTESEDRQVQSIGDQLRLAQELEKREGFTIVETLTESKSARYPGQRPAFAKLIEMIESGEADTIITWHPDRLARNAVDGGWILDLLDRGKLKAIYFTGSYTFENTPEGKLMLGFIFSHSKYYVDKLSKEVQRGFASKREKGEYPHIAPEGYLNDLSTHTIVADPDRFPLLRRAVELLLQGNIEPLAVLSMLNEQWGYRTRRFKKRGGTPLSKSGFYKLLGSSFYYGLCQAKGGTLTYKGTHPPLLSEKEFHLLQARLGRSEKPRNQIHELVFKGLMRCGNCGCQITASRVKGHVYYHCTNARKVCNRKGTREELIDAQIVEHLKHLTLTTEIEAALREVIYRHFETYFGKAAEVAESSEKTVAELRRQLQNLTGMRLREMLTDEEYLASKRAIQEQVESLERTTSGAKEDMALAIEQVDNLLDYAVRALQTYQNSDTGTRRRVVELLGTNFCLTEGKVLWEPNPYLAALVEGWGQIQPVELLEIGSESTKKTSQNGEVSVGRGLWTLFKLSGEGMLSDAGLASETSPLLSHLSSALYQAFLLSPSHALLKLPSQVVPRA